jgi:hypothetical protein
MLDNPSTDRSGSAGKFGTFLTTVPGMVTAAAAVVTAVGGLYLGLNASGPGGANSGPVAPPVVTQQQPSDDSVDETTTTTPPTTTEAAAPTTDEAPPSEPVDTSGINLAALDDVDTSDLEATVVQALSDCGDGSGEACIWLFDQLTLECDQGFGLSCDALYFLSPVDSDYEFFGATCGYRVDEVNAGTCEQF